MDMHSCTNMRTIHVFTFGLCFFSERRVSELGKHTDILHRIREISCVKAIFDCKSVSCPQRRRRRLGVFLVTQT
ncbi:hypothetical protein OIU84_025881 [Salix udensis]|uniref:Uncharacterized protein n=1 Tax=Salix udensis TaxID=889485 RepID=A0AAD6KKJ2_9ROSI|nr:hypothetical protein OIU84_025881 [Salix udensis]